MSQLEVIDAVKNGETSALARLLDEGADVDQQDEQGWTPLNWAAGRGDAEAVKVLLEHGADVTRTGRDNRTPLMIAKAAERREVAELLTAAEQERGAWEDPRETREYCKAYYVRDLRAFEGWPPESAEENAGDGAGEAGGAPLGDDDVAFVHQDLTVTRSMWHGENVLFDDVTPEWRRFCEERLEFHIPEDLL